MHVYRINKNILEGIERTLRSWEGEIGGVSVTELLRGPLLCDGLPDVLGDTSCLHKTKLNYNHFFLKVFIEHFNYKVKLITPLTIKTTP